MNHSRLFAILLGITLAVSATEAQRLRAWNISTDSGISFQVLNGANADSFKWAQLRGHQDVPPRTARHGRVQNIQLIEGGDAFGRAVLLWSGWEGNGGNRAEYWLKGVYKSAPIYEGVRLGAAWSGGDLFHVRMWNEQYFSWQERRVVTSLYAENAPLPTLVSGPTPAWTDLSSYDLKPRRRGIQIDPAYVPAVSLNWQTGETIGRRLNLTGLKRVVSLDNYTDETRPSPFRDDLTLSASVSLRVNNQDATTLWSVSPGVTWSPLDGTQDYTIGNQTGGTLLDLTPYPLGTILTLTYEVEARRTPYDENGQIIPPPPRDLVDDLRDGRNLEFDLKGLHYRYSGAISGEGDVTDEDADPLCVPKQSGTLDIQLNLRDFGLPYDVTLLFAGTKIDGDTVRWSLNAYPDLCVEVDGNRVLIKRIWGQLTAQVQRVPLFYDNLCGEYYNLRLVPEGGDAGNWLNGELYALCYESSFTRVNVEARQINYEAFGGGQFDQIDPRLLYRQNFAQLLELAVTGDVNDDFCVNDADLAAVLSDYGRTGELATDLNNDGVVDDADLQLILRNYGRGC